MNGMQGKATYDVLHERNRQIMEEGYSIAEDDKYVEGQLAKGAAAYALVSRGDIDPACALWPFDLSTFRPDTARRDLIKAAAMIFAEIERLDRLEASRSA